MIEGIDHINIVVDDMPKMVGFYTGVLGLRLTKQAVISGPWIEAVTGLSPVEAEVAFLEVRGGPRIELICYHKPESSPRLHGLDRSNVQGFRHIALRVTDLDQLIATIETAGLKVLSAIQQVPTVQVEYLDQKKRLVYCRDPEGNLLELCAFHQSTHR
jgi:catechol 2,3-dioxygenase-like lactoylglutathione lyase family enzyme